MNHQDDLLERVVAELTARGGQLRKVAADSGLPYDTVLRIKNRENDPGYSKVRTLAVALGLLQASSPSPDFKDTQPEPGEHAAAHEEARTPQPSPAEIVETLRRGGALDPETVIAPPRRREGERASREHGEG
jgi:hypothetical protein